MAVVSLDVVVLGCRLLDFKVDDEAKAEALPYRWAARWQLA